ncbi:hypothetical protein [Rheinheimera sp.]|uniref:hypothetical protein n=1 Tax=Rheinheimera sp. TaxID=1869214 RepID=UPI00307D5F1D
MSDYYWVFFVLVMVFFILFISVDSEQRDQTHLVAREKRKVDNPGNVREEDLQLMGLYKLSPSKAVNYYRKKYGTGLKFTEQLLKNISKES